MPRLPAFAAALATLLAACSTPDSTATIAQRENLMSAAGFTLRPADTPARVAALKQLPAHRFVQQQREGRTIWLYADPTLCNCLYLGGPDAYRFYRQLAAQRSLANAGAEDGAMSSAYDWAPWGDVTVGYGG
jgi:hypothetical protein